MQRQRKTLNVDVLREVFKYFVAVDENGPFTLILLSTYWQDSILSSPSLWTYIHVNDGIADLDARLETSVVLSAGRALHIIIRMPYNSPWALRSLIQRCLALTIDRPASSGTTEAEDQNELLELAHIFAKHVLRPFPPTLMQIFWYKAGKPSRFYPIGEIYLNTKKDGERHIHLPERYATLPPLMITSFTIALKNLSFNDLHVILSRLWQLQDLQINISTLSNFPNRDYKFIELPFLQTISLLAPWISISGTFWDILSYIRAPMLKMAALRGEYDVQSGLVTASRLITALRPRGISLTFRGRLVSLISRALPTIQTLESIRFLEIEFSRNASGQDGYDNFHQVNRFVQALPNLQVFHLCITHGYIGCLKGLLIPHGALNLSISSETVHGFRNDLSLYFSIGIPPQIDQLEISPDLELEWETFWSKELSTARTIIVPIPATINRPPLNILIEPRYWSINLVRLDLGHLCFSPEVSRSESAFGGFPRFTSLTEIRCMPQVVHPLLSWDRLPYLQQLILLPSEGGWSDVETLLLNMSDPPPLHTLGFLFYPDWTKLYKIIQRLLHRYSSRDLFSIKLPSLPHQNILIPLVAALRGEYLFQLLPYTPPNARPNIPPNAPPNTSPNYSPSILFNILDSILGFSRITKEDYDAGDHESIQVHQSISNHESIQDHESIRSYEQDNIGDDGEDSDYYMSSRGCVYCERSGWTCEEPVEVCDRHSLNDLVTITQYTLL